MAVVAALLLCSGDVETNPGPPECESIIIWLSPEWTSWFLTVELVSGNLKKLCNLVSEAKSKWFELGFQLDIDLTELEVIKAENTKINTRFLKMLSTWLTMIDPLPHWEGLLTALEHDTVRCGRLADNIRRRFDLPKQSAHASAAVTSLEPSASPPSKYISSTPSKSSHTHTHTHTHTLVTGVSMYE